MGLFLAMSCVLSPNNLDIRQALKSFTDARGGRFEMRSGTTEDDGIGVIRSNATTTSVFYPAGFGDWDEYSAHLSNALSTPVFSFHIHDGDFWMFVAFRDGQEVARFNPLPEYWESLDAKEVDRWRGDADAVAALVPGLNAAAIKNYFVQWTEDVISTGQKAHPDDEYRIGDEWQMIDFMRRLGFDYPIAASDESAGETFYLTEKRRGRQAGPAPELPTNSPEAPSSRRFTLHAQKKPWWKFW